MLWVYIGGKAKEIVVMFTLDSIRENKLLSFRMSYGIGLTVVPLTCEGVGGGGGLANIIT